MRGDPVPPTTPNPPTRAPVPRGQNGVTGRGEGRARCYALKKVGCVRGAARGVFQIVGGKRWLCAAASATAAVPSLVPRVFYVTSNRRGVGAGAVRRGA